MWLSVAFATDAEHAEALSDALLALGALSVGVEDAHEAETRGAVELAAFLGCLRAGFVPPAAGFTQPDPALRITPLTGFRSAPKGVAMLNFFGFGGNYASLLIAHG